MWTNSQLKRNAWANLKPHFLIAFITTLIVTLLTGQYTISSKTANISNLLGTLSGYSDVYDYSDDDYYDDDYYYHDFDYSYSSSDAEDIFSDFTGDVDLDGLMDYIDGISYGIAAIIAISLISGVAILAYRLLFANPLKVGHDRFYLDSRMGGANTGRIFSQFSNGYGSTVKTMFLYDLKLFLWSLPSTIPIVVSGVYFIVGLIQLFAQRNTLTSPEISEKLLLLFGVIILGLLIGAAFSVIRLVKTYEYFLVPYIIAENPDISSSRAFELSKKLMKGEKMHVFGLHLSFIGWYILAAIASSIIAIIPIIGWLGSIALLNAISPYVMATNTEFYCCMREKAMASGISDSYELNGIFGRYNAEMSYSNQGSDSTYQPYSMTGSTSSDSSGSYNEPDTNAAPKDNGFFHNNDDNYNGPEIK